MKQAPPVVRQQAFHLAMAAADYIVLNPTALTPSNTTEWN